MRLTSAATRSVAYAAALATTSLVPCAAFAASMAIATTDLNIRSGPGPEYPVVGAINANSQASIEACVQGSRWCQVTYHGKPGWAYTEYMQPIVAAAPARTVTERRTTVSREVTTPTTSAVVRAPATSTVISERAPATTVVRERTPTTAVVSEQRAPTTTITTTEPAAPAPMAAANEFGVPSIVYQAPTSTVGSAPMDIDEDLVDAGPNVITAPELAPPESVGNYVVSHPVNPVYLNGEVVVGAGLPPSVALQPVPDYDYDYAYVNRQPVLVEPQSRRIVYVYR